MTDDPRCCGTGTCIINEEGLCWCGQKWDGEKMCFPHKNEAALVNEDATKPSANSVQHPSHGGFTPISP
jgi:hypothetical protein